MQPRRFKVTPASDREVPTVEVTSLPLPAPHDVARSSRGKGPWDRPAAAIH